MEFSYPSSCDIFHCERFSLKKGQRVFLHGSSGSGKSTLLNLLSGIAKVSSGSLTVCDTELTALKSAKLDMFRATKLGIVFQQFNLISYLSVLENVQLAAHFARSQVSDSELVSRVETMLASLKLSPELIQRPVSALSVGQQQRVAIMRAFINQPELLLVDEPTSSLDASSRDGFMELLLTLCDELNASLVFVSHDEALRAHFDSHLPLSEICYWSTENAVSDKKDVVC